jgi:BMFP domain-containing protein YqiC
MTNARFLDDLAAKISALLAATPAKDLERNMRAMLTGAFARLDLVTREEFDVQRELLSRTRERLVLLEARIAELETKAGKPGA